MSHCNDPLAAAGHELQGSFCAFPIRASRKHGIRRTLDVKRAADHDGHSPPPWIERKYGGDGAGGSATWIGMIWGIPTESYPRLKGTLSSLSGPHAGEPKRKRSLVLHTACQWPSHEMETGGT